MALLFKPMHLNILLRPLVPRLALQRVVILQPMRRRHAEVRSAHVEQDVRRNFVDVSDWGGRKDALRLGGSAARRKGAVVVAIYTGGRRVNWVVDIPLVKVLFIDGQLQNLTQAKRISSCPVRDIGR